MGAERGHGLAEQGVFPAGAQGLDRGEVGAGEQGLALYEIAVVGEPFSCGALRGNARNFERAEQGADAPGLAASGKTARGSEPARLAFAKC